MSGRCQAGAIAEQRWSDDCSTSSPSRTPGCSCSRPADPRPRQPSIRIRDRCSAGARTRRSERRDTKAPESWGVCLPIPRCQDATTTTPPPPPPTRSSRALSHSSGPRQVLLLPAGAGAGVRHGQHGRHRSRGRGPKSVGGGAALVAASWRRRRHAAALVHACHLRPHFQCARGLAVAMLLGPVTIEWRRLRLVHTRRRHLAAACGKRVEAHARAPPRLRSAAPPPRALARRIAEQADGASLDSRRGARATRARSGVAPAAAAAAVAVYEATTCASQQRARDR